MGGSIFYEVDFAYFRVVDQAVDQWFLLGGGGASGLVLMEKDCGTGLLGCGS